MDGKIKLQPGLEATPGENLAVVWRIDNLRPDAGSQPVTFTLDPGRYVLRFSAVRPLNAKFYSQQRFNPTAVLELGGLRLATNRTFDLETGSETTVNLNTFGQHVFGSETIAPTDRWSLELSMDDNPAIVSVSSADVRQPDLGELSDAVLALEYVIREA